MFTEESSTQQTSPNDGAVFSEERLGEAFPFPPPPIVPSQNLRWHKLLVAIGTWFLSVLLLVFVPVVVAVPYVVYVWRTRGIPRPEVLATDKTLLLISILGIVPTHLLTLLALWLVVTEWRRLPFWTTIGFRWPESLNWLSGTTVCILIAATLFTVGTLVTGLWGGSKTDLDLLVESSIPARFATAFVAVFTAPLVEELIYRGVLYSAVEQALGRAVAIGSVALLFAGVHVIQYKNNISVIVVITLLSFTLTFLRAYTGKLLPSFVVHLVFNGIQSVIIVLAPFFGWGT